MTTERKSVNEKVDQLSEEITDTVQDLVREAKPLLSQATERMNELKKKGLDAVCRGKNELENKGHDLMDHAAHMIRHQPLKAVLIAAGIGAATVALIGMISRSNSDDRC